MKGESKNSRSFRFKQLLQQGEGKKQVLAFSDDLSPARLSKGAAGVEEEGESNRGLN